MREGDLVRLVPCSSSSNQDKDIQELLELLTEDVHIIKLHTSSDNAKVRDMAGVVFYCNPSDLISYLE
jgi:hypothetical protein